MKISRLLIWVFIGLSGYLFYNGDINGGSGYLCAVIAWITLEYAEKKYELAADELEDMYVEGIEKIHNDYVTEVEKVKQEVTYYTEKIKQKYLEAVKAHTERITK